MLKFDHRSLIHGIKRTKERVQSGRVNKPPGFEPLNFYCIRKLNDIGLCKRILANSDDLYLTPQTVASEQGQHYLCQKKRTFKNDVHAVLSLHAAHIL